MLNLFCQRSGISFGQVFAVGAGEMLRSMVEMNTPFGEGSLSYVKKDWNFFVEHIVDQKSAPSVFCSPKYINRETNGVCPLLELIVFH